MPYPVFKRYEIEVIKWRISKKTKKQERTILKLV